MEKFTIIDAMKARHRELTTELNQLTKAMAALDVETNAAKPKAPRAPGAPKLGRPKRTAAQASIHVTDDESGAKGCGMSPAAAKAWMTIVATLLPALGAVPALTPFLPALTALSGALLGWAHGPQPGTAALKEQAKAATDALARSLEAEK